MFLNDAECSLNDVACSLDVAECPLNDAECSPNDAECYLGTGWGPFTSLSGAGIRCTHRCSTISCVSLWNAHGGGTLADNFPTLDNIIRRCFLDISFEICYISFAIPPFDGSRISFQAPIIIVSRSHNSSHAQRDARCCMLEV